MSLPEKHTMLCGIRQGSFATCVAAKCVSNKTSSDLSICTYSLIISERSEEDQLQKAKQKTAEPKRWVIPGYC